MLYSSDALQLRLPFVVYRALLAACDHLLAPELTRLVLKSLEGDIPGKAAWEVFKLASQHRNVTLAREAICQFDTTTEPAMRLGWPDDTDMEGVEPSYYLCLVRRRLGYYSTGVWESIPWAEVATSFDPS